MKNDDFNVVILGADANAYFMARNIYEAYGKKVHIMALKPLAPTLDSRILTAEYDGKMHDERYLVKKLRVYAEKKGGKIILVAASDFYARVISKYAKELAEKYLFNYPEYKITEQVLNKEEFFKTFKDELDLPETRVVRDKKKVDLSGFSYPLIIKPVDIAEFREHMFEGWEKVYKVGSEKEAREVIRKVFRTEYKAGLILQEYIPGAEDNLFYVDMYFDSRAGEMAFSTFARILLQEHDPEMIGNTAILVNGERALGGEEKILGDLERALGRTGYKGSAQIDLKYDERTGNYRVLEINPRLGRASYYTTLLGVNMGEVIVEDLVFRKVERRGLLRGKAGISYVPNLVVKMMIKDGGRRREIGEMRRKGRMVNPLSYDKDMGFKRRMRAVRRDVEYVLDYMRYRTW